jgi:hypothetical protein
MKKSVFIVFLLTAMPNVALADIEYGSSLITIFAPTVKWKIIFPKSDWMLEQEKRKPNGGGYYYFLSSKKSSLSFSIFLDKTRKCHSSKSCQEMYWSNPEPEYKHSQDVVVKSIGEFNVLQFYIDKPKGYPVIQSNLSAHSYRDGFWIDLHLSTITKDAPNYSSMTSFLKELKIE